MIATAFGASNLTNAARLCSHITALQTLAQCARAFDRPRSALHQDRFAKYFLLMTVTLWTCAPGPPLTRGSRSQTQTPSLSTLRCCCGHDLVVGCFMLLCFAWSAALLCLLTESASAHSDKLDLICSARHGVLWQVSDPAVDSVVTGTRCLLMLVFAQDGTLARAKAITRR